MGHLGIPVNRTTSGGTRIRRATARDARRLTRIVRSSRAYEGPYAPMTAGYRIGPDYIETHEVFVAVEEATASGTPERVLGFYALLLAEAELDLMFVADDAQGRGLGRLLAAHLADRAREAGLTGVRVVAHPPSEGFYLTVGARRTGTVYARPPAVMFDRPEMILPVA
ncbi:GNAT family N-acetyltransferase [Streptomyces sp. NPDC088261]|uniref:GNAT family N-acetyltransferase n=1 Tax=Streptomyces sp. NPDC088261 TaxID=3365851 RepID=UPI0037F7EFCB